MKCKMTDANDLFLRGDRAMLMLPIGMGVDIEKKGDEGGGGGPVSFHNYRCHGEGVCHNAP